MVPTPTIILVMKYFKGKYILYLLKPMSTVREILHMSQLLLLGKFEYGGGPIFKVVLEC